MSGCVAVLRASAAHLRVVRRYFRGADACFAAAGRARRPLKALLPSFRKAWWRMCPTRAASCPPAWRRPTGACPGTPNGAPAVAALPTTLGQPLLRLSAQLHRAFHAMSHRACLLRIMTLTRGVFLWRQGARCAGSEAACGRLGARRSWPARGCCGRGGACGGGARRQRRRARRTRRRVRFPLSFSLETEAPSVC